MILLFAGCAKQAVVEAPRKVDAGPSVPLVVAAEKSSHFDAVNAHLELGGTLYGYVDVDGDALDFAARTQQVLHQFAGVPLPMAPLANLDLKALFEDLGLDDIKAVGFSSVREADTTFRNRAFLYTPGGRHGLLAALGGKPGEFAGIQMAPPDTDFYSEIDFDVMALYGSVRAVVERAAGKEAASSLEKELKDAGAKDDFSALDLIQGFTGRAIVIVRMDPDATFQVKGPGAIKLPAFSALVRVEGIGDVLARILTKNGEFVSSREGSLTVFTPQAQSHITGLDPVLAVDGRTFYATSSLAFLKECIQRKAGMETNPEFASGLAALGPQGNGLTWVSPRFFATLRNIGALNPSANPQQKHMFDFVAVSLPVLTRPLFSVRSNLPDGVLVRSNWNRSLKGDLAMISVYNPVTLGLVAAMAVPAFQKVRQASQQKAVMNNLSLLYGAAEQYYEINGLDTVHYEQLVGPGRSVKEITPVAGEDYQVLVFKKGNPLRLRMPDGSIVSFPPFAPALVTTKAANPPSLADEARRKASEHRAVINNLYTLDEAAKKYYIENKVDTVAYADLVGPGKLVAEIKPVAGEDYTQLVFTNGQRVEVSLADGRTVHYPLGKASIVEKVSSASNTGTQAEDPRTVAIEQNLQALSGAADKFYSDHTADTTTYEELVGPGRYLASVTPVAGEDYRPLLFKKGHPLRLYLKDGKVITYPAPPAPQ